MPIRVLVADDEELERRALGCILSREGPPGIEIIEAANGVEAVEAAGSGSLDMAFLDIQMPGMDGIEAARRLREAMPGLPIVFLTAHDSFEYARSALRLRVEDFLLKPATVAEVAGALERSLAQTRGRARGERERGELESALGYMADEVRAALSAGRVDDEGLARYAGMRCRPGCLAAVVAIGAQPDGHARTEVGGLAALAERCLSSDGRMALAGSCRLGGPGAAEGAAESIALCAVFGAGLPEHEGRAGKPDDASWIRLSLESLAEKARAELGEVVAIGAAVPAPGAGCGGEGPAASGADCAKAALRALALAAGPRPIVLVFIAASSSGGASAARDEGRGRGGLVARALELMEARCAEELSLDGVAAELGISPSHLSRLLGREAGLGFADCLGRLRVDKAKAFLATGRTSVKEAAAMVGFRDPAYFARVFRRFSGMSPAQFRAGGE